MLRGAIDWGSQAAKAYLFSTFPKLTENTLPDFKCFRAPWESHAAKWGSKAAKAYHPAKPYMLGRATVWGSQAAKGYFFSTFPKLTAPRGYRLGKAGCQGIPFSRFPKLTVSTVPPLKSSAALGAYSCFTVSLLLTALQTLLLVLFNLLCRLMFANLPSFCVAWFPRGHVMHDTNSSNQTH